MAQMRRGQNVQMEVRQASISKRKIEMMRACAPLVAVRKNKRIRRRAQAIL